MTSLAEETTASISRELRAANVFLFWIIIAFSKAFKCTEMVALLQLCVWVGGDGGGVYRNAMV